MDGDLKMLIFHFWLRKWRCENPMFLKCYMTKITCLIPKFAVPIPPWKNFFPPPKETTETDLKFLCNKLLTTPRLGTVTWWVSKGLSGFQEVPTSNHDSACSIVQRLKSPPCGVEAVCLGVLKYVSIIGYVSLPMPTSVSQFWVNLWGEWLGLLSISWAFYLGV